MTRWTIVALALVCVALAGVVFGVVHLLRRDRAALVERYSAEKLQQVEEAATEIKSDFDDVVEDLGFAGQLVQVADSASDRQRELGALLAAVKQYRIVQVYDGSGALTLSVRDPLAGSDFPAREFEEAIGETARRALRRPPGEIETSPPIQADPGGWFRVFATPLPSGTGVIAVLVDTKPFFARLRLVVTAPGSRVLVLGAHGRPIPATDPALAGALARLAAGETTDGGLARLVAPMRGGQRGTERLADHDAQRLGLGSVEAIAAFAPIEVKGGGHWSIAILESTRELRSRERAILLRLGLASGGIVLCLFGFGGYVVVTWRRAVAVRERLRNAEELAHLHEKTEKILDNVPSGVMALSETGRITALNRVLRERVAGSAVGGDLGAAFPEAPPAVVSRVHALLDRARATDRVQTVIGQRLALFGEEGQYSLHAVPLEPRFAEARTILVIEDVSEVRSLESQLLRAEKLATVGVLAAGIAHEIGTPLGVIRARAEYLAGKLGPEHPLASGTQVIVDQADRVSRTIRQLLDFSRVKPAAVQPVEVGQVARAVVELLRFELERRKVSVELDLPGDVVAVAADPDQLQQVLVNVVLNACDACAEGGRVRLGARAEPAGDAAPWAGVRLEVEDDGCGIPEELRHQIFDPFFTTKKRGKGTGLGLSIAAQIVRNHGGQIDLESEPGRGTRVTLLWPSAPPPAEERARASR